MTTVKMPERNGIAKYNYVMCIFNKNYPASLELWKVYKVLPDEKADQHGLIRVIDESEEDYLYPQAFFVPIRVPVIAQKAMRLLAR